METAYVHMHWENYLKTLNQTNYAPTMSASAIYERYAEEARIKFENKTGMKLNEFNTVVTDLQKVYERFDENYLTATFNRIAKNFSVANVGLKKNKTINNILKNKYTQKDVEKVQKLLAPIQELFFELYSIDQDFFSKVSIHHTDKLNINSLSELSIIYNLNKGSLTSYINLVNLIGSIRKVLDEVAAGLYEKSISELSYTTYKTNTQKQEWTRSETKANLEKGFISSIEGYFYLLLGTYFEYALANAIEGLLANIQTETQGGDRDESGKQIKTDISIKYKDDFILNLSIKGGGSLPKKNKNFGKYGVTYKQTSILGILDLLKATNISYADLYKFVLYNSAAHMQKAYRTPTTPFNTFSTKGGDNNAQKHVSIIRDISALLSYSFIGTDIDFVLYRDRFFSLQQIMLALAQKTRANQYILTMDIKDKNEISDDELKEWYSLGKDVRSKNTIEKIKYVGVHIKI